MLKRRLTLLFMIAIAFGLVFLAADAVAQPAAESAAVAAVGDEAGTPTAEASGEVQDDEELPFSKYIEMLLKVISDFRTLGVLAGFVALVGLLVAILRLKILNEWLEKKGWKKYKPYIAAGLGAILGFLTALANGKSWVESIAAGVTAGVTALAATGGHQLITGNKKKEA